MGLGTDTEQVSSVTNSCPELEDSITSSCPEFDDESETFSERKDLFYEFQDDLDVDLL